MAENIFQDQSIPEAGQLVEALLAEKIVVPYEQRHNANWCKLEQERNLNASR